MATETTTTEANATTYGNAARDAYWEEFGVLPEADGKGAVGDWDSSAWGIHWHDLKDSGATDQEYDSALKAWRKAFWGVADRRKG